MSFEPR